MCRNMNVRNFGLRSRDIVMAAKNALIEGMQSYSSIATMSSRFKQFSQWEKETYGVGDLRWITKEHLQAYARHMADQVKGGHLTISTAHNYISAANRVLEIARMDRKVHVRASEYIANRTSICTVNKAFSYSENDYLKSVLSINSYTENQKMIGRLIPQFGLRLKEASLLNIKQALHTAINKGYIKVNLGTKGGRVRKVPICNFNQILCLKKAAQLQGKGRSLIPVNMNYRQWKDAMYRFAAQVDIKGWHGGRHFYAQDRYYNLTGVYPPIVAGIRHGVDHINYIAKELNISFQNARKIDKEARLIVAQELGHGRIEITNNYLG